VTDAGASSVTAGSDVAPAVTRDGLAFLTRDERDRRQEQQTQPSGARAIEHDLTFPFQKRREQPTDSRFCEPTSGVQENAVRPSPLLGSAIKKISPVIARAPAPAKPMMAVVRADL
jgi:hypothetical protein